MRPSRQGKKPDATAALLVNACELLAATNGPALTRDVARAVGLSPFYFQRLFKKHLGVTPQAYRRRCLAERARAALGRAGSVTEAVYEAGYASSSRFYEGVGRELGMTAAVARRGALGELIRYAIRPSSLGRVLVAWTERGVCQVGFGDADELLVEILARRFPRATFEASPAATWVDAVLAAVERGASVAKVPLDIRGTVFQERVWRALRRISAGTTRTYAQVAAALGKPTAARAVARACATNELAVVVPCHRVVRSDGDLAGYRWGVGRKRELLRREEKKR